MDIHALQLLIVEDDAAHAEAIRRALTADGMDTANIRIVGTLREYNQCVRACSPDIALIDLNLPDGRAVDVLQHPPEAGPYPILIMTSFGNERIAVEAMRSGALDYVVKSSETFADMPRTVKRALREWKLLQERRQAEIMREDMLELLRICNRAGSLRELMKELMQFFQKLTTCEAIGVRLQEGEDFPYYEYRGFTEDFILAENSLCITDTQGEPPGDKNGLPALDCMCGNILCGRFDPSKPFFSPQGSFWSSCTSELLAGTSDEERQAKTRNRCNGEGYESVALIPLCSHGETFGLFQFNDRRRGCFSAEKIVLLEDMVSYVAIALAKLRSDDALQESSQFSQQIINSAEEGIIVYGPDLRYQVWNPYMEQLTGLKAGKVLGRHPLDIFPFLLEAGAFECIAQALSGHAPGSIDYQFHYPHNGRSGWVSDTSAPMRNKNGEVIGVIGTVRDITDRKVLEQQLRQSQKMEAIGQLAGGVAHDFNNILTVIYGYCNLIRMRIEDDASLRDNVDQLLAAAERAANLTRGLLSFSRKQVMAPKPVNLNDVIKAVGNFLIRIIGEDIRLTSEFQVNPLTVFADSGQIEQVLMNLATNARDAMQNGGLLKIETRSREIDQAFIKAQGFGTPGFYAVMSVSDSGEGMDAAIRERIFDPFFTTKEVGKGTGLGLSIIYGIVNQHNGFIDVYSEPGKGTTFNIYIPLMRGEHLDLVRGDAAVYPGRGNETILVAEDDAALRQVKNLILEKFGYRVIFAKDGVDAIAKFDKHRGEIDLVIMDMIMPLKNGLEASREIRLIQPDVKILFVSGYSQDLLQNKGFLDSGDEILVKPIQPLEFLRKVRSTLDSANNHLA